MGAVVLWLGVYLWQRRNSKQLAVIAANLTLIAWNVTFLIVAKSLT